MWVDTSIEPELRGYYFAGYINPEDNEVYYKSIAYSVERNRWCDWRYLDRSLVVLRYVPATHYPFYGESVVRAQPMYKGLMSQLRNLNLL
jgi:hypothetical protein